MARWACAAARPAQAGREAGVEADRLLVERGGAGRIGPRRAGRWRAAPGGRRCRRRGSRSAPRPRRGARARDPQRRHHRPRDLVLHREDVAGRPLVGLGPEIEPLAHAHQVDGDAEPVVGLAHAALEHGGDVEPAAGLAGVLAPALEREGGGGRGDPEPRHPAERGGQLLGHAVAEILVGAVGAGVDQGEDGDRAGPRLRARGRRSPAAARCSGARA